MACRAGSRSRRHVSSGEGEAGDAVIERGCIPACWRMAICAIRRGECRTRTGVDRGGGLLPSGQVAL